jgi:hypothetical protein
LEFQTDGFYQFFGWYGKQLMQLGLRRFEPPHHKGKVGIVKTSQAPHVDWVITQHENKALAKAFHLSNNVTMGFVGRKFNKCNHSDKPKQ